MKTRIIFRGGRIFDGDSQDLLERDVLVENDRITEVSTAVPDGGEETDIVDCAGRVLLIGEAGQLGCIRAGALADLLVVEGNPLEDILVLTKPGETLAVIMKNGRFHKRTI